MRLYIMRHGDAILQASSDAQRPLSPLGIRQCQSMIECFSECLPDAMVVSPYLRAQQTANQVQEGLLKQFDRTCSIETLPGITPNNEPAQVLSTLAQYDVACLLMVSHQRLVGSLVSLLVNGHMGEPAPMTTAAIACVEAEILSPGMGVLNWIKTPQ